MIIYDKGKSAERRDADDWRIDMSHNSGMSAEVIRLPRTNRKGRKQGLNRNREGSIRNMNGTIYVDFRYMGERVRESAGLRWNEKNVKTVRQQLDKIILAIKSGEFRFAEVFPESRKKDYFTQKEERLLGMPKPPGEVSVADYAQRWIETVEATGRMTGRTLRDYKSYLNNYIKPFFENYTFAHLNKTVFERFVAWSRNRQLKNKVIGNKTINNIFIPLKLICKDAAIEYNWGAVYNPFFGFKKLKEDNSYEKINPCTLQEQQEIVHHTPTHWKPYIRFAFCCGMRHGEQTAIKPGDIDWQKGLLHIRRAMTRDAQGKIIEGRTKNAFSRRTIKLTPGMIEILTQQKKIHNTLGSEYFFCTPEGKRIDIDNFRKRVWATALEDAGVAYRDLRQTRHSFATTAFSNGVNPLYIAHMMGHRNTEMIINVYSKYVENNSNNAELHALDRIFSPADSEK